MLNRGDIRTMQKYIPALEMLRLQQIKQAVEQYTSYIERRVAAKKKARSGPGLPQVSLITFSNIILSYSDNL